MPMLMAKSGHTSLASLARYARPSAGGRPGGILPGGSDLIWRTCGTQMTRPDEDCSPSRLRCGAMHAETVVALVSIIVGAIVPPQCPWMTFRFTVRQDQARWLREQRAQLYADLLSEAYAEQEWLQYTMADDEIRERMREHFTDIRLPPGERARRGARGTIFGSKTVNSLFTQLQGQGQLILLQSARRDEAQLLIRVKIGELHDQMQAHIRAELGADSVALDGGSSGSTTANGTVPR